MARIIKLSAAEIAAHQAALVTLLQDVVNGGASVGFLPLLSTVEAERFWQTVAAEQAAGLRLVLAAFEQEQLLGSVQLALVPKPNGRHRAEVQKLIVRHSARRQGLGRALWRLSRPLDSAAGRWWCWTRVRTMLPSACTPPLATRSRV